MIPGLGKMSYEDRLEYLGVCFLEVRRNRSDLLEVFRMFKELSSSMSVDCLSHH